MRRRTYEEDICMKRAYTRKDTHMEGTCTQKTCEQRGMQYVYKRDMHIKEIFARDIYIKQYIHRNNIHMRKTFS